MKVPYYIKKSLSITGRTKFPKILISGRTQFRFSYKNETKCENQKYMKKFLNVLPIKNVHQH